MSKVRVPHGWYHAEGDPPGTSRFWNGEEWIGEPIAARPAPGERVAEASNDHDDEPRPAVKATTTATVAEPSATVAARRPDGSREPPTPTDGYGAPVSEIPLLRVDDDPTAAAVERVLDMVDAADAREAADTPPTGDHTTAFDLALLTASRADSGTGIGTESNVGTGNGGRPDGGAGDASPSTDGAKAATDTMAFGDGSGPPSPARRRGGRVAIALLVAVLICGAAAIGWMLGRGADPSTGTNGGAPITPRESTL